eukprot:gene15788-biopygen10112
MALSGNRGRPRRPATGRLGETGAFSEGFRATASIIVESFRYPPSTTSLKTPRTRRGSRAGSGSIAGPLAGAAASCGQWARRGHSGARPYGDRSGA